MSSFSNTSSSGSGNSNTVSLDTQLQQFRDAVNNKQHATANKLLPQLKIGLTRLRLVPPFTGDQRDIRHALLLARETYELAVLLALQQNETEPVARLMAQLRPFYSDYASYLPDSERKCPLLGVLLLLLLANNRLAEFHNEIQLICNDYYGRAAGAENAPLLHNLYIKYPIALEQELMFGSYKKILDAKEALTTPTPLFTPFINILLDTVREKVAECSESAYTSLPLSALGPLLRLESRDELNNFVTKRGWRLSTNGDRVMFPRAESRKLEIASLPTIRQSLHYATELERIV